MNSKLYIDVNMAKDSDKLRSEVKNLVSVILRLVSNVNKTITYKDIDDFVNDSLDINNVDNEVVIKLLRNKDNKNGEYKDYLESLGINISNIIFKIKENGNIEIQKEAINAYPVLNNVGYDGENITYKETNSREIYKNTDTTEIDLNNINSIPFKQKHNIKYTLYTNNHDNEVKRFNVGERTTFLDISKESERKLKKELVDARNIIRQNASKLDVHNKVKSL